MPRRPLIALADPLWIGHRETYCREFVRSLDRLGADIIALCPEPAKLEALPLASAHLHTGVLTEPARLPFLKRLHQDPINTHLRWRRLSHALQAAEKQAGRRADFLFLPWLDSYLRASMHGKLALARMPTPWAGLYFQPYHLAEMNPPHGAPPLLRAAAKGDALLRSPSCRAVATLDETIRPALEQVSRKPVLLFPDITDETAPDKNTPFAKRIREKANGRKVIGLIGMEPRKGVVTLLKAADVARAQGQPWLFVVAGKSCFPMYSETERRFIEEHIARSRAGAPDGNVLFPEEFDAIPDGAAYNGVMDSFDVLFVAYHDFLGSSNVLTKSSILKKPVVSTDLGCMAHRTKAYDLGLTIPQGDAAACCAAIERVLQGVRWDGQPLRPRHADYHAGHSRAALDQSMNQVIGLASISYA
jgi:glycosyltransferase involved in cell wall biosynthesis